MPGTSPLSNVGLFVSKVLQAGNFERIGQIGCCVTRPKNLSEGAASGSAARVREIVMQEGFARGRKEEEPVLFDWCTSIRWVAGELGKGWI